MSKIFSANRIVLILHAIFVIATAASIFAVTLSGSLPKAWQPDVAFAVTLATGIAASTVAVTKFLDGSQKSEANSTQYALKQIELEQEKMYHERAMAADAAADASSSAEVSNSGHTETTTFKADLTKSGSGSGTNLPPAATSSATKVATSEPWWKSHPDFTDSQSANENVDIPSDSSAITSDQASNAPDNSADTAKLTELVVPENLDSQLWLKTRQDLAAQTEQAAANQPPSNTTESAS